MNREGIDSSLISIIQDAHARADVSRPSAGNHTNLLMKETMLVSAFAKKSSTSALLTLFMLLILPLILEAILGMKGLDTWFLLGSLGGADADVVSGGGEP